jgi:hypothetical protein
MSNTLCNPSRVFVEAERTVPVLDRADVAVMGGGPGGVAAAIAAARQGADTVLVERFGSFGGTWTGGLLSSIMPYPFVKGLFQEIIDRLDLEGGWRPAPREDPYDWTQNGHGAPRGQLGGHGCGGTYDAEKLKVVLDQMVLEAGVRPYFFLMAAGAFRDETKLEGIVVESKEGRALIAADYFIDSTGDGDIASLAGVPTDYGRISDGGVQPMTMIFKMDGVDDAPAMAYCAEDPSLGRAWQAAKQAGEVTVPRENVLLSPMPVPGQWVFNTTRILGKDGTRVRDVTAAMIEGRRQVAEIAAFMRRWIPGFARARISETASHIGVRETRRVRCDYTMTGEDIVAGATFEDGIARGNWYIDIHNPKGEGTHVQPPPAGHCYEVPFRSLCAQGLDNLLIASRCIDCTHEAHAAIRITPQIVAIGQAAGTAAGLCAAAKLASPRTLDAGLLRETLRRQGASI